RSPARSPRPGEGRPPCVLPVRRRARAQASARRLRDSPARSPARARAGPRTARAAPRGSLDRPLARTPARRPRAPRATPGWPDRSFRRASALLAARRWPSPPSPLPILAGGELRAAGRRLKANHGARQTLQPGRQPRAFELPTSPSLGASAQRNGRRPPTAGNGANGAPPALVPLSPPANDRGMPLTDQCHMRPRTQVPRASVAVTYTEGRSRGSGRRAGRGRVERIWAPWRGAYVATAEGMRDCFLCRVPAESDDQANLLLYRGRRVFVVLNRYPYNTGHL